MRRLITRAALLAALILPLASVSARADDWELLGARKVSYRADHDVIAVTAREGWFRAIKIEVDDGNLELWNIRVVFGNGESFSPETRLVFREDSRSRTIDLPGGRRFISRVEFNYRSRGSRGRAEVRLYGVRHEDRRPHAGETPGPAAGAEAGLDGWTRLGTRTVNFRAEKDAIDARGEGPFRRIMLQVEDGDIEMFDVQVVFGNGRRFSPATRLVFNPGNRTRVIDLPGASRDIRRVEFTYRSIAGGGEGRATVTLYGR
jgi:hypothetical protein